MSSSCIEDLSIQDNQWYRIAHEMLGLAGIEINGSRPFDIQVKNPEFFKRVLQQGSLGLGESYMDGWWECERLDIFFQRVVSAGLEKKLPHHLKDTLRIAAARLTNLQSKKRAWIVGKEHYDLGNDLFTLMLDPYMQYSCGYWKDATTLEEAQEAKLRMICEKLQLQPGMRLLDIGCGWGALAERLPPVALDRLVEDLAGKTALVIIDMQRDFVLPGGLRVVTEHIPGVRSAWVGGTPSTVLSVTGEAPR